MPSDQFLRAIAAASTSDGKSPQTLSVLRHSYAVETAARDNRNPSKVRSRFVCVCGCTGEWTSPTMAAKAGDAHIRDARRSP